MPGEQIADGADAFDDAAFEPALAKPGSHAIADRLPSRRADFALDAAVRDDFDVAIAQRQVDQHAAVALGVPHAQRAEELQRALARRLRAPQVRKRQTAFHREAQLPAMALLGFAHRLLDVVQHGLRKRPAERPVVGQQMPQCPHQVHLTISPTRRRRRIRRRRLRIRRRRTRLCRNRRGPCRRRIRPDHRNSRAGGRHPGASG